MHLTSKVEVCKLFSGETSSDFLKISRVYQVLFGDLLKQHLGQFFLILCVRILFSFGDGLFRDVIDRFDVQGHKTSRRRPQVAHPCRKVNGAASQITEEIPD